MNSLGSAFEVTKKILASVENLTYDKALIQLKEAEQAMKPYTARGVSLATVNSAGIPTDTRYFECSLIEHWKVKLLGSLARYGGFKTLMGYKPWLARQVA